MTLRMRVTLDRKKSIRIMKKFDALEDNTSNWEKVSVAKAEKRAKAAIESIAESRFDYHGDTQLNDKPDQISLASSYKSDIKQARNSLGQFASGVVLDIEYTAPHAKALEKGVDREYTISPKNAPRLSFLVKSPQNYAAAASKSGTKVRSLVGNRVTIEDGESVIRKPRKGYEFLEDGIIEYWRQESGSVDKEFFRMAIKSGFKPG